MKPGPRLRLTSLAEGTVRAEGALDFPGAAAALALGEAQIKGGGPITIDLSGLNNVDSAGLAVLIEWQASAVARAVQLRYANPPQALLALARMSDAGPLLGFAA